ncbi:uncharacterized protein LOC114530389 [Dendronephthya gigantea]|uniref:uncharacterized protein LOC114530389 n=1 Tax=Dendronephthya gigantea TaxID=151771 RepID=UPI00106B7C62|nr:uncharacterized protein LOC114530389 [Dendronephthya gigantea]
MESGDSDPEMYITQSSTQRERSFPVLDDLYQDTIAPDEYIWPFVGEIKEVEEQPSVTDLDRFGKPVCETEVRAKIDDCVPKSTRYKDKWAVTLFENWREQRNIKVRRVNERSVDDGDCGLEVIENSVDVMSDDELNRTLACFICEVRKSDGSKYPPNTLYGIIAAIQHFLKGKGKQVRLLNDDKFEYLRNALDAVMKESASAGLGLTRKQGEVITLREEEQLWEKGVLGDSQPQQLLDTLVYLFGIHFALRGGNEHRRLRADNSQIIKGVDKETGLHYLEYREDVSKTNAGGIKDRKLKRKVTRAYENKENKKRCIVRLYDKYVSLCPSVGAESSTAFYRTALKCPKPNCWYSSVPVGHNKLASTVKRLCELAGLSGYRTNHSLRATAATRMYDKGVDEQLICEKTGHRSDAVRAYKRTSSEQQVEVSDILYGVHASTSKKIKEEERCETKDKGCVENKKGENESSNARISGDKSSININFSFIVN